MRLPGGERASYFIDGALVFLLAAILIFPLFRLNYMDNWGSIESTFISDARFLRDNGMTPLWQPNWYIGTRTDFVYPPALRYGTAWLSRALDVSTARSYHLYIAIFYCIGILGMYLLVRIGSGSRGSAWLAAAAAALVSPTFLFIDNVYGDAKGAFLLPHRLNVLIRYGEGPHMSAMAVLPIALAAAWIGLRPNRRGAMAVSAIFSAIAVSNNFYGATALAVFFPVMVWAVWVTTWDHRVWIRAAAIGALAYGLTAFWLTPSYLVVTLRNMKQVSKPGTMWSVALALVVVAVFVIVTIRWAKGRAPAAWPVFIGGSLAFMGLNVLGQHYFNFRVMGEPERLCPEFDIAFQLVSLEILRRAWRWRSTRTLPSRLPQVAVIAMVILCAWPARHYVKRAWIFYPETADPSSRIEYRITHWMAENMPGVRAVATGTVRFWYNAWHDLPQLGGGSEQGLLNEENVPAYFNVTNDPNLKYTILWMQAMGTGAIIVHDKTSQEHYHDYEYPYKFKGGLKAVYDDGKGNWVYIVPRRYPGLARVVEVEKIRAIPNFGIDVSYDLLGDYVNLVENGPDAPTRWRRRGTDAMFVRARVGEGQGVLVQESYDPSWVAYSGAMPLRTVRDPMGMLLILTPPGEHEIRIQFRLPAENFYGRILFCITVLILLLMPIDRAWHAIGRLWARPGARTIIAAASIFTLNVILNPFLFLPGEPPYRDSVESGYASTARFITGHPNPWGWDPAQYAGLPTQFTYLPALNYATAFLTWITPASDPSYVYRIITATLTCLGPVTVFVLVLYFARTLWVAFLTGLACTLFSPAYYFFFQLYNDRGLAQLPLRLHVLLKYGEGPHNAGLTLLPLAIIALWRAATGRSFGQIFLAAVLLAAITLTNWIAAMVLAWCCFALLISGIGTGEWTGFRAWRALAAAGVAYLLACFWLTPSFLRTTAFNWPKDAFDYKMQSQQIWLMAGLAGGAIVLRLLFLGTKRHAYLCFLVLSFFGFAYVATGFYRYRMDTLPESRRYTVEAELFLFVLMFEMLRRAMQSHSVLLRGTAIGVALLCASLGAGQLITYAEEPFVQLRPFPIERTPEYRTSKFLAGRHPQGRVFVSGGTRYRLNQWFDIPQLGGVFETGLSNRMPLDVIYQVRTAIGLTPGKEGPDSLLLLKGMGIEYIVTHGPQSKEYYRDYSFPRAFDGVLETVYDSDGDTIYRLPFRSYAHLMQREELAEYPPVGLRYFDMKRYVRAMEDSTRPPLRSEWQANNTLQIEGGFPAGMLVWVQVSHDPGWTALQDGAPIPVEKDVMGFMLLQPKPAASGRVTLEYRSSVETKLLGAISALAWIGCIVLVVRERRRK